MDIKNKICDFFFQCFIEDVIDILYISGTGDKNIREGNSSKNYQNNLNPESNANPL